LETLNKIPEGCALRKLPEKWEVGIVTLPISGQRVAGISTPLSTERGWWNDVASEANEICGKCRLCSRTLEATGVPKDPHLTVVPRVL